MEDDLIDLGRRIDELVTRAQQEDEVADRRVDAELDAVRSEVRDVSAAFGTTMDRLTAVVTELTGGLTQLTAQLDGVSSRVAEVVTSVSGVAADLGGLAATVGELTGGLAEMRSEVRTLSQGLTDLGGRVDGIAQGAGQNAGFGDEVLRDRADTRARLEQLAAHGGDVDRRIDGLVESVEALASRLEGRLPAELPARVEKLAGDLRRVGMLVAQESRALEGTLVARFNQLRGELAEHLQRANRGERSDVPLVAELRRPGAAPDHPGAR